MTSFDENRCKSLKPGEAEEAIAQLKINKPDEKMASIKVDEIGGDRARDPGFFTFFPTDKQTDKSKENIDEASQEDIEHQVVDGASPVVDGLSPVKAAQMQLSNPPKVTGKRQLSFKM